jgi:cell division FtsZ-interacting protein ZapD
VVYTNKILCQEYIDKYVDKSVDKTESINKISQLNKHLEQQRESYKNNQKISDATKNSINELKEKFQDKSSSTAASYIQIEFFARENKISY